MSLRAFGFNTVFDTRDTAPSFLDPSTRLTIDSKSFNGLIKTETLSPLFDALSRFSCRGIQVKGPKTREMGTMPLVINMLAMQRFTASDSLIPQQRDAE